MNYELIMTIFSGIGVVYFFYYYWKYDELLLLIRKFSFLLLLVYIIYMLDWGWKMYLFDYSLDLSLMALQFLILIKNMILGATGVYFLTANNIKAVPIICIQRGEKINYSGNLLFPAILTVGVLVFISLFVMFLYNSSIISHTIDNRFIAMIDSLTRGFIISVTEEIVYRLFLIGLFIHWLSRLKWSHTFSIILASIVWASIHPNAFEYGGLKFIQIMLIGVVLGILMEKKGIEACMLSHWIFNILSYTLLTSFIK